MQDDHPEERKKSFAELFTTGEIVYYGIAVLVYIVLGVLFTDRVLNFVVGPLFFIGWMWAVPPLWERWRDR
ncbi:MAG: hypothetical protein QF357_04615 [Dehalococcoidia bacterium]|nr:hypothetical protein [Dehalococcoidia bacterium]